MDVHQEWRRFEQAYRYQPKHSKEVERHYLKHLVRLLRAQGYTVLPCGHNGHWDLTIGRGGREVAIFGYTGGDNKVWIGLGASCELLHL